MTKNRKPNANLLFRIIVLPATVLCAVFRKPVFQWISVGALGLWLLILLIGFVREKSSTRPHPKAAGCAERRPAAELADNGARKETREKAVIPDDELFLIRQVNARITEQLKVMYPSVSWLWVCRPQAEELRKGGTWRIRVANTDPFNYAEVSLHIEGRLEITMLQAIPLKDAMNATEEQDDLTQSETLERVDVKTWYTAAGELALAEIVDNLNSQGHRKALVREDGSVVIRQSGSEEIVDHVPNFPPRIVWEEFCQLLREDDYEVSIRTEGLELAWK